MTSPTNRDARERLAEALRVWGHGGFHTQRKQLQMAQDVANAARALLSPDEVEGMGSDQPVAWSILEKLSGGWEVIESDGWMMTIQGHEDDPGEMIVDTRARSVISGSDQPLPSVATGHPEQGALSPLECELYDHVWDLVMAIRGGGTLPHVSPQERANAAALTLNYWLDKRNASPNPQDER